MSGLAGMRVALLEARMTDEIASLVRRYCGEPICVPAVREEPKACADEVAALLGDLSREASWVFIFSTGVGVVALFREAQKLGREDELKSALQRAITVARGPKPVAALKRQGIDVSIKVHEPYTTKQIIEAICVLDMDKPQVVLLHYGERNQALVCALVEWGMRPREILLYEWRLPEDTEPLRNLVTAIIEREIGAIAFTSQIQARHLFQVASEVGLADQLALTLNTHTWVAAVGPTCAAALEALGVVPRVVPSHPKMGAMILSLAERVSTEAESLTSLPSPSGRGSG